MGSPMISYAAEPGVAINSIRRGHPVDEHWPRRFIRTAMVTKAAMKTKSNTAAKQVYSVLGARAQARAGPGRVYAMAIPAIP